MTIQQRVLEASRQADRENPERCRTNRNVDCFQHTARVLALLGQPWAFLGKRAGESQYSPDGFAPRPMTGSDGQTYMITGVSHDAITNGVLQFDLLGAGNDGPDPLGLPAIPQALEIPAQYHRPGNPPVPAPLGGVQPIPAPSGMPSYEDLGGDAYWRTEIGVPLQADMAIKTPLYPEGQTLNDGSSVWFSRPIFLILEAYAKGQRPDRPAIIRRVRNEWRGALGLPPL